MIILENKYDCCGCHACVTICPRKCISMHPDQEGFLYPSTDQNLCVDCHLCENVCPMISQKEERKKRRGRGRQRTNQSVCRTQRR